MIEVTARCDIDAPAEAVWSVLGDLEHALAARARSSKPAGEATGDPAGQAAS